MPEYYVFTVTTTREELYLQNSLSLGQKKKRKNQVRLKPSYARSDIYIYIRTELTVLFLTHPAKMAKRTWQQWFVLHHVKYFLHICHHFYWVPFDCKSAQLWGEAVSCQLASTHSFAGNNGLNESRNCYGATYVCTCQTPCNLLSLDRRKASLRPCMLGLHNRWQHGQS